MRLVLGVSVLNYEEFYTFLVLVEAILNSRPLTHLSSNSDDLVLLTPAHFLLGRHLMSVPEVDLKDVSENRLYQYQHIEMISQHLWERWNKECIYELQFCQKWKQSVGELEEVRCVSECEQFTSFKEAYGASGKFGAWTRWSEVY